MNERVASWAAERLKKLHPHGMFAAGGGFSTHTRKKKKREIRKFADGIFAAGRVFMPTQEKKKKKLES